jgi:hypothetical protein
MNANKPSNGPLANPKRITLSAVMALGLLLGTAATANATTLVLDPLAKCWLQDTGSGGVVCQTPHGPIWANCPTGDACASAFGQANQAFDTVGTACQISGACSVGIGPIPPDQTVTITIYCLFWVHNPDGSWSGYHCIAEVT